jgi:acyl carrier protein
MRCRTCRRAVQAQNGEYRVDVDPSLRSRRQAFMNTTEQTLDEILTLAAAHFKVPREKLHPDDDFFKTLGIDSLQALDLLTKLENQFRVELPDYELQGVSDFRTLAGKIQARL